MVECRTQHPFSVGEGRLRLQAAQNKTHGSDILGEEHKSSLPAKRGIGPLFTHRLCRGFETPLGRAWSVKVVKGTVAFATFKATSALKKWPDSEQMSH